MKVNKPRRVARWCALVLAAAVPLAMPHAAARTGIPGDVNLDGEINILDVQGAINMVLETNMPVPEADVTASGTVDVTDVQVIINTALDIGGLVQPVAGALDPGGGPMPEMVAAVSVDGRTVRAPVDPATGAFRMTLDVGTSWSFGVRAADGGGAGTLIFPVGRYLSSVLPLLQLSTGEMLDLGVLPLQWGAAPALDLRTLLGNVGEPLNLGDYDGNGLPDLLDALLFPLPDTIPFTSFELPPQLTEAGLVLALADCLNGALPSALPADLSGMETGGIPDVLLPLMGCLEGALLTWLEDAHLGLPGSVVNFYAGLLMDMLEIKVPDWLNSLSLPELTDTNGNFIPDFLEPALCVAGVFENCLLDRDGDGIPDFARDDTRNGLWNLDDPEAATPEDLDGDGVPNELDLDANGDGRLDYATAPDAG